METDYFTKWVEAEAFVTIKDKDVTRFLWKSIICCFGLPQRIVSDNGPQFDSSNYRKFCTELGIRNLHSSPCYPLANGQVEATNKSLLDLLKKMLQEAGGHWVKELPGVLWAHQTTQ